MHHSLCAPTHLAAQYLSTNCNYQTLRYQFPSHLLFPRVVKIPVSSTYGFAAHHKTAPLRYPHRMNSIQISNQTSLLRHTRNGFRFHGKNQQTAKPYLSGYCSRKTLLHQCSQHYPAQKCFSNSSNPQMPCRRYFSPLHQWLHLSIRNNPQKHGHQFLQHYLGC